MELTTAAECYHTIPRKVLTRLAADGLISLPLSETDHCALTLLSKIWSSEWYVAQMNKSFKPDKRAVMLAFPDLGKADRYVLNAYLNLKPHQRVSLKAMGGLVRKHLQVNYPEVNIKRMRQIAYNLKRLDRQTSRKRTLFQLALLRESPHPAE